MVCCTVTSESGSPEYATLLAQLRVPAHGPQRDAIFRAFKFQLVTGRELQFSRTGLGSTIRPSLSSLSFAIILPI